jgi:hypothetical protein
MPLKNPLSVVGRQAEDVQQDLYSQETRVFGLERNTSARREPVNPSKCR